MKSAGNNRAAKPREAAVIRPPEIAIDLTSVLVNTRNIQKMLTKLRSDLQDVEEAIQDLERMADNRSKSLEPPKSGANKLQRRVLRFPRKPTDRRS